MLSQVFQFLMDQPVEGCRMAPMNLKGFGLRKLLHNGRAS